MGFGAILQVVPRISRYEWRSVSLRLNGVRIAACWPHMILFYILWPLARYIRTVSLMRLDQGGKRQEGKASSREEVTGLGKASSYPDSTRLG